MNELAQLYSDLENFEKDFEKDNYTDETLARLVFQEYINSCFSQMSEAMHSLNDTQ